MNKEQADGKFEQLRGEFKKIWGKLTDDDIMLYNGKRDVFFGKLKEHYGLAKEEAEKQIKAFEESHSNSSTSGDITKVA
jgi:uncharacterized protein YjbJ (UPF0337 family)